MVGHCQPEPQVLSSINLASLQLSTSISMPFSPYRQYRMSDHLNRARVPVQVPAKQSRMQPVRAHSYDAVASSTTYRPVYHPTHASMAASRENVYTSSPLATTYTPDSFNLDPTYLGSCQTPHTADSANMWGQSTFVPCKTVPRRIADVLKLSI